MKRTETIRIDQQKSIGIISLYGWLKIWDNYGTLLQNFALQKFLQKMGYSTFWIRTRSTSPSQSKSAQIINNTINDIRSILRFLASPILGTPYPYRLNKFNARHPRKFKEFMSQHTPTSRIEYTFEELVESPPQVDALIVGSDQVWRDVNRINFLDFGSEETIRVAYAVSAPWQTLDEQWIQDAKRFTPNLNSISVREIEGLGICNKLNRNDAFHALDPVLLLNETDYLEVIRKDNEDKRFTTPFVLGYFVNLRSINQIPWQSSVDFAKNRKSDLLAIPMQGAELVLPVEYLYVPTPSAWMNAFHKSDCVITNSYHGALFAVIMKKPFLVFLQGGNSSHQNGRFTSALKPLGIESRILSIDTWSKSSSEFLEEQMAAAIDWDEVNRKLGVWRNKSEQFLVNSLAQSSNGYVHTK